MNELKVATFIKVVVNLIIIYCKMARAKLPANAGNFTCGPNVKRPHTQLACVTCSLPVKKVNLPASMRQAPLAKNT